MPDAPVVETPYSMADVASRHAGLFANPPADDIPDGTDIAQQIIQKATEKPEPKVEAKPDPKEPSAIPDEILGKKTEVDEWETLHNEEVKGQVKNENFKRYKEATGKKMASKDAEIEAIRRENEELKTKYTGAPDPKEIETLRTALKEKDDLIGRKYVEESAQFRERFTSKQKLIEGQLAKSIEQLGLDKSLTKQLLNADLKKRAEILENSELSSFAQGNLATILTEHDRLDDERASYLEDWQSRKAEMEAQEMAQTDAQKARIKEHEDRIFQKTFENLSKTFGPLQKYEGREDWNKGVDEILNEAKRFFDGDFTTEEYAELAIAGVAAKRQNAMLEHVIKLLRESQQENESLKAAGPSVPGFNGKPAKNDASNNDRFTHADAMRAFRNIPRENEV